MSCDGWSVTTVEGLGSTRDGLSAEQDRLSQVHGTQCGFCTPGMVMSMHGPKRKQGSDGQPPREGRGDGQGGQLCAHPGHKAHAPGRAR